MKFTYELFLIETKPNKFKIKLNKKGAKIYFKN